MNDIITKHHYFFEEQEKTNISQNQLKASVKILNSKGIIIISGIISSQKTGFVKTLLEKTQMLEQYFYYNHSLQNDMSILTNIDLKKLYHESKVIVLENCHHIEKVHIFIQDMFKKGKKIILLGNHYNLKAIHEEEIFPSYTNTLSSLHLTSSQSITEYINLISQDIFIEKKLKNFPLIKTIISTIAQNSSLISVRELHSILEKKGNLIAQITLLDYINHFIEAKLIKKVSRYNLKNNDISTGKAKYYFSDTALRKAASSGDLDITLIKENIVFQRLLGLGYEIYTGKNGTFNFSFLGKKKGRDTIVHVSSFSEKGEVKKEAKKLLKILGNFSKYLIVDSIKDIGIRPSTYLPLKIVELEEFLERVN